MLGWPDAKIESQKLGSFGGNGAASCMHLSSLLWLYHPLLPPPPQGPEDVLWQTGSVQHGWQTTGQSWGALTKPREEGHVAVLLSRGEKITIGNVSQQSKVLTSQGPKWIKACREKEEN